MSHDLVAAARRGDEDAWAELYRLHGRRLVGWLRALAPADASTSAEDIAHDAWLTAAQKIADFRGDDGDFAGWLFGISRNHSLNRRRTAVRRATSPVADQPADRSLTSDPPADPAAQVASEDHVRWMLGLLSPREAEVVACIDVAGLDVTSTARALGISPVSVRVARHRALGRLRAVLATAAPTAAQPTRLESTDGR